MKNDYPNANARLAEVAKSWAEGEVSHDEWRKERRSVIASLLSDRRDWLSGENRTQPPKRTKTVNSTLPTIKVPPSFLATSDAQVHVLLTAEVESADDDVMLLALLLLVMILTAILLLYVM